MTSQNFGEAKDVRKQDTTWSKMGLLATIKVVRV